MISNSIIMELIADGVQWYYLSYDHKAAVMATNPPLTSNVGWAHHWIPDDIQQQFPLWRVGKLRSLRFDPDGMINRMYIGRMFKFAKRFFPQEVGETVKPILNKHNDKHGLINAGIAIDETQIKT